MAIIATATAGHPLFATESVPEVLRAVNNASAPIHPAGRGWITLTDAASYKPIHLSTANIVWVRG